MKQQKGNAAGIPSLSDYIEKLDPRAIHSVKHIEEKFGIDGSLNLTEWYEKNADDGDLNREEIGEAGFVQLYGNMLNTVIAYEKEHARRIAKKRELMRNNEYNLEQEE